MKYWVVILHEQLRTLQSEEDKPHEVDLYTNESVTL